MDHSSDMKNSEKTASVAPSSPDAEPLEALGPWDGTQAIHKIDEFHSHLLEYQASLEEKNRALESATHFVESVLDAMSDVLVVCDEHGKIQNVNRALSELVGRPAEELVGRTLVDLCSNVVSQNLVASFPLYLQEQEIEDCEIHLLADDGSDISVAVNCTARQDRSPSSCEATRSSTRR